MLKMKATKKTKKSLVNIKAAAPEPAQPVPVQSAGARSGAARTREIAVASAGARVP